MSGWPIHGDGVTTEPTVRRHRSSVTTVSWIPSEAVTGGANRAIFGNLSHYDDPLPERIGGEGPDGRATTLDTWLAEDRFRFSNQLSAWIDVGPDGHVLDAGYDGTCRIGHSRVGVGGRHVDFRAASLEVKRRDPEFGDGWVNFVQSYGGRTGLPFPRRVNRPPFVQFWAPLVWTSLSLTIFDDGSADYELIGASPFPRHWLYDGDGELVAKSGTTNFKNWSRRTLPRHTPWGDTDSPALVTAVESAVERELSRSIMRGGRRPMIRSLTAGRDLMVQGEPGADVILLLDGVVAITVDGELLAELGPGAVLGERALLEGGRRTSTVRAVTNCRIAVAGADDLDMEALSSLVGHHRREESVGDPA